MKERIAELEAELQSLHQRYDADIIDKWAAIEAIALARAALDKLADIVTHPETIR